MKRRARGRCSVCAEVGRRCARVFVQMMVFNNGQERTMPALEDLARGAGWRIDEVHFIPESANLQIVAVPLV